MKGKFASLVGLVVYFRQLMAIAVPYDGVVPKYECVQAGAQARLACPNMRGQETWKRLSVRPGASGSGNSFSTFSLPAHRVLWNDRTKSVHIINVEKSDEGLYGVLTSGKDKTAVKCPVFLSISTDTLSAKTGHLELLVNEVQSPVQLGGSVQIHTMALLNGMPYSGPDLHIHHLDANKNNQPIVDKDGHITGAGTGLLKLSNVDCTIPRNILISASTQTASAEKVVHLKIYGQKILEPTLPSVLYKSVGERVKLTTRLLVCEQPQVTWKGDDEKLVSFSTRHPSQNSTIASRQAFVTYNYDIWEGVLMTTLLLFSAKLSDEGTYTIEVRVGENVTAMKMTLQLVEPSQQSDKAIVSTMNNRQQARPTISMTTSEQGGLLDKADDLSTTMWVIIVVVLAAAFLCTVILLLIFMKHRTSAESRLKQDLPSLVQDPPPVPPRPRANSNERLNWLLRCSKSPRHVHYSNIAEEFKNDGSGLYAFLCHLGVKQSELPNLELPSRNFFFDCIAGLRAWEGCTANITVGALVEALVAVNKCCIALEAFSNLSQEHQESSL